MLVLGVARFRPGVQHQREEHRAAFNAHLMQPLNPRIRLAGPMFEPSGAPSGVFMLFETDTIETLHRFLSQSPYGQADMFERVDFDVVQVEVGHF
jgi:uncharacterized protein YciI